MAADDVVLAIIAMKNDDSIRQRVRDGDLAALADRTLNEQETAIIRQVADEGIQPEVESFSSGMYAAYNYAYGQLSEEVQGFAMSNFGPVDNQTHTAIINYDDGTPYTPDNHCSYTPETYNDHCSAYHGRGACY